MADLLETVDALDGVPEDYRVAYAQGQDGKFALKPEFKPFVTAINGLNTQTARVGADLKKANGEAAERRKTLKAFEELLTAQGITVEEGKSLTEALKAHMDELATKAKNGGELKVDLAKIRAEFEKKSKELKDEADAKVGGMTKALERYLIGQQATTALAAAKGSIELLLPIIQRQVKVVQDGEDYAVRVVDDAGNVRSNGKGGLLSIEELVGELKTNKAYAPAFASETKGGSNVSTTTRAAQVQRPAGDKKSATDKIKAGLASGRFERGQRAANA